MTRLEIKTALDALELLANSMRRLADVEEAKFKYDHPTITVSPVFVGKAEYDRKKAKPEEQGDVFPEYIGPREAKLRARQQKQTG